ncbi:MAG: hypothetical protein ACD_4C00348G0007, partial [uncultured bacterium (gcode 4)]
MQEKTIETKTCKHCSASFDITDKDLEFYDKISPIFNSKKYNIPTPTLCPDCRQQRRLAWRNERYLYKRKCDFSWNEIISIYSPDKTNYKIFEQKHWWSDNWNAFDYARNFDFERPFFEQFDELMKSVPRIWLINRNSENSDYCNNVLNEKNSYLTFISWDDENCHYSYTIAFSKDCSDILWGINLQNCYECVKSQNSYGCKYCFNIDNCSESQYLKNCIWVKNSCFCVWLINKEFHILNKTYSKQEYHTIIQSLKNDKDLFLMHLNEFDELQKRIPVKSNVKINSEKSIWDYLLNTFNCVNCFDISDWKDSKYSYDCVNVVDIHDSYLSWTFDQSNPSQFIYEAENLVDVYSVVFSSTFWSWKYSFYSDSCFSSSNLFG